MKAPGITYRFQWPKDTSGLTFEVLSREFFETAAAAAVTFDLTGIPKDKVLVLSNLIIVALPGAAQNVADVNCQGFTQAGAPYDIIHAIAPAVVGQREAVPWQGEVYQLGRGAADAALTITVNFDAGAAANQIFGGIHGIIIPRGNSAQF